MRASSRERNMSPQLFKVEGETDERQAVEMHSEIQHLPLIRDGRSKNPVLGPLRQVLEVKLAFIQRLFSFLYNIDNLFPYSIERITINNIFRRWKTRGPILMRRLLRIHASKGSWRALIFFLFCQFRKLIRSHREKASSEVCWCLHYSWPISYTPSYVEPTW